MILNIFLAEAQARQAFLNTLNEDVIKPLTSLKVSDPCSTLTLHPIDVLHLQETQERTRKRIKEDLKDSGIAYNDYVEVLFPKLKSRYAKKFAEVEVCDVLYLHCDYQRGNFLGAKESRCSGSTSITSATSLPRLPQP